MERLVAITHGDPKIESNCGRPLIGHEPTVDDPSAVKMVYFCPLHGAVRIRTGPSAPFAYHADDMRIRRGRDY